MHNSMQRIVHLDLKGAPPKIHYLEKVLLSAKHWGASGILLEWEDTFPYVGELVEIGSGNNSGGDDMYSVQDVRHIMKFAKENGLEVIQLIQTIGHMEYALKHPTFRSLREAPLSPAVLCPSKPQSQQLVRLMVEQILNVQPDAQYLHIGADEVWHTGVCTECKRRAATNEHQSSSLYLEHVRDLALFIKERRPHLTVLMWDDMLRSISVEALNAYQLGELIQPVLWHYNPKGCFQIDPSLWDVYKQVFPRVWVGSAFKGANGSCQVMSPVSRYVSNHEAWVQEIRDRADVNTAGVILTGWSRYDHYATLCELLPVSLPSLACCLRMLTKNNGPSVINEVLPSEQWPGEELVRAVHAFVVLRDRCNAFLHGDMVATWLNPWQQENKYTNPAQIEGIAITAQELLTDITTLESQITTQLLNITGRRSTEEWVHTFTKPLVAKLTELHRVADERFRTEASVAPSRVLE